MKITPLRALAWAGGLAIAFVGSAHATVWKIESVQTGGGGFGASLFHLSTEASPMSGSVIADIPNITGDLGYYDDATGVISMTLDVTTTGGGAINVGPTFTLDGDLAFDGDGLLAANNDLTLDFANSGTGAGANAALVDTVLGFLPGWVCCGSSGYDPNSFKADPGGMIMTLWGANGFSGAFAGTYGPSTTLGIDLRIHLSYVGESYVSEPSTLALLGSCWY